MIDKRVIVLIGVLVVAAVLILVVSTVNINFSSGQRGISFTALIDTMQESEPGSSELVLADTYSNNQQITITDKIIAMKSTDYSTAFYFLYSGAVWVNETSGTNFDVITYQGEDLHVRNALFSVTVNGDIHALYDVGDMITLRTSVKMSGGHPVLSGIWVVIGD